MNRRAHRGCGIRLAVCCRYEAWHNHLGMTLCVGRWLALAVVLAACAHTPTPAATATFDLVLARGRVIDPETGLDAVRDVGLNGHTIAAISESPLRGRVTIDVHGLVVAPGFIDLHQRAQDPDAYAVEVRDGTTSALDLEEGTADVAGWYASREGKALIHYGVAVGHTAVRMAVMHDPGPSDPSGDAAHRAATDAQLAQIRRGIERGLAVGAPAVGILLGATPAARPREVLEIFEAAAAHRAVVYLHLRGVDEPFYLVDLEEAIAASVITGAAVHVEHLPSTGHEDTPRMLAMMRGARLRGVDITTECYPYTASMLEIRSPMLADWERWPDEKFARIEWAATGARLTRDTFARYRDRETDGYVVLHSPSLTEDIVQRAVADPLVMIASDGLLKKGVGHPRTAGTFARVLGHYVRDVRALPLIDALRKMTVMPAQRLERRVPAMRRKGRVQVGMDADLVVLDPAKVVDRATYREPTLPPAGIPYVIVAGEIVVNHGEVVPGRFPGRAIRAPLP